MIHGFAISNYRSFGKAIQRLSATDRFNIIIGKNNSGKSNILRAMIFLLPNLAAGKKKEAQWDDHLDESLYSTGDDPPTVGLLVTADDLRLLSTFNRSGPEIDRIVDALRNGMVREDRGLWIYRRRNANGKWFIQIDGEGRELIEGTFRHNLQGAVQELTGSAPVHRDQHAHALAVNFSPFDSLANNIALIPALRSTNIPNTVGTAVDDGFVYTKGIPDFGGMGLVERLFKLQNPNITERRSTERFRALNDFARSVLADESAVVQVPHDKSAINVELSGKRLPLTSLGSGIEQVVVIAAAATVLEDHIICLEEPETNLHPEFQIRLLKYLFEKTPNQYFITTHSSCLIDLDGATLYGVRAGEQGSEVQRLLDPDQRHEVVFDLGYRPSDLAQCNCVVWVEGPSDRIYLKAAIGRAAPELIDGIDYSIMFYGGRLLSHLSADDNQIEEFIVLSQINRRSAIVIDSDRRKKGDSLNATKTRVISEFEERDFFVWVTAGREIENYVAPHAMQVAQSAIGTNFVSGGSGQFDKTTKGRSRPSRKEMALDKVELAHSIVATLSDDTFRYDWNDRMGLLIDFIRNSS